MTAMLDDDIAELRHANAELSRRLDERTAERDEGEAQKAAMAEVLEVINSSPGELGLVFDAMLERAFRLCDGVQGSLWTFNDGRPRLATARGISAEFVEILRDQWERHGPSEDHPMSRLLRGERVVQILDISASELYRTRDPTAVAAVELGHVRTLMFVALMRESAPAGAFIVARREVRRGGREEHRLAREVTAAPLLSAAAARARECDLIAVAAARWTPTRGT